MKMGNHFIVKKNCYIQGLPLVVQWLRLCASTAGATDSIPDQGTKIPHASQNSGSLPSQNSVCCCSVTKSYLTLCNPMDCSMPASSSLHYLSEFAQIHVH